MRWFSSLARLANLRISFGSVPPCDVLIFHEDAVEVIERYLIRDEALRCRALDPYRLVINAGTLAVLSWGALRCLVEGRGLREIGYLYYDHLLRRISPRLVVTRTDDCRLFGDLAARHPEIPFAAIQNGTRPQIALGWFKEAGLSLTNFYCFGQDVLDRYAREGIKVERGVVCGPLMAGIYAAEREGPPEEQFDIGYVGQWDSHETVKVRPEVIDAIEKGLRMLAAYVKRAGGSARLTVFGRNRDHREEKAYYDGFFDDYDFIPSRRFDGDPVHIYRMIDRTNLTIVYNTTAAFEMLAFKKKVLFCDPNADGYLEDVADGLWIFRGEERSAFDARVDALREMSVERWWEQVAEYAGYLNALDPACLPHDRIHQDLQALVAV